MYKNSLHISQYTLWLVLAFTFWSIRLLLQSHVYYRLHGILQTGILEWVAFPIFMGPSQPRGQTQVSWTACRWICYQLSHKGSPRILECLSYPISSRSSQARTHTRVSCIAGGFFTNWDIKEALQFCSVQSLSHIRLCDPMDCSKTGFLVQHQHPAHAQTHVHQIADAIQLSHPLSSPSPPAFNLPSVRVFSSESVLCIRWPKDWSFSFSQSFQWIFRTYFL